MRYLKKKAVKIIAAPPSNPVFLRQLHGALP